MADWLAIKTEYITTRISTRDLAQKHGVSYSTLRRKAEKEGWVKEREEQGRKLSAAVAQKTVERVACAQADRMARLMACGDQAARLLGERLDQIERSGKVKPYEVKTITESLKHIRDLYRSDDTPDDSKFQKARELLRGVPDALE